MKRLITFCLLFTMAVGTFYAQSASEILKKYTEHSGGQANWDAVKSLKVTGTAKLPTQGMELPFVRIMEKDGKQKTTLKVNGMDYISIAYNGKKAWGTNPQMQAAEKGNDELQNTKNQQYDFPYPGHNWKKRGYKAAYLGQEKIDSILTHKITLSKHPVWIDGEALEHETFLYLDVKTYLPVLTETISTNGPNKGQIIQSFLSNYQSIGGLLYPFKVVMKSEGTVFQILETQAVEWNPDIDPTIYKMP